MLLLISCGPASTNKQAKKQQIMLVSPLIFGTNLSLQDQRDQILTSNTSQSLLQQLHAGILRIPEHAELSSELGFSAAQTIKHLGAQPVITLRGSLDQHALEDDTQILQQMQTVFGEQSVYYEYGNEEDLLGQSVEQYVNSWNSVIPALKKLAPHAQFIGPVTYHYDATYLTTFLQHAQPEPDAVSWHEYSCTSTDSQDTCIAGLSTWSAHIGNARSIMQKQPGGTLPILITEWNYAANAHSGDGKSNDNQFMRNWTTKALQTLIDNSIFASMQYSCTNTATALIASNNTLTAQGKVFQNLYKQYEHAMKSIPVALRDSKRPSSPPSLTPSGTATGTNTVTPTDASQSSTGTSSPRPTRTPPSQRTATPVAGLPTAPAQASPAPRPSPPASTPNVISFEDGGVDGWFSTGHVAALQNSSDVAYDGSHSLKVTFYSQNSGDFPYVSVSTEAPKPGQTLTAYVYRKGPGAAKNVTARLYFLDSQYHWYNTSPISVVVNSWTRLTYTIPANTNGPVEQIGVQFASTPYTVEDSVYIDAINWK